MPSIEPDAGFQIWHLENPRITIRARRDVVRRLHQEAMAGFAALRRRGAEVGGILLGTAQWNPGLEVSIEDYSAVRSEYRYGPSYILSDADKADFQPVLQQHETGEGPRVVGYYRSHTRKGLTLTTEDMDIIRPWFLDASRIFLIIKPDAGGNTTASFFFWQEGNLCLDSPLREFPFGAVQGEPSKPKTVPAPEPAPVQEIHVPRDDNPAVEAAPARRGPGLTERLRGLRESFSLPALPKWSLRQRQVAAGALAVAAVGLCVFAAWKIRPIGTNPIVVNIRPVHQARPGGTGIPPETAHALGLTLVPDANGLRLRWNREAIGQAERGILAIHDGDNAREIELDRRQLEQGSIFYVPAGSDINFELQTATSQPGAIAASESIRYLRGPEGAQVPQADPEVSAHSRSAAKRRRASSHSRPAAEQRVATAAPPLATATPTSHVTSEVPAPTTKPSPFPHAEVSANRSPSVGVSPSGTDPGTPPAAESQEPTENRTGLKGRIRGLGGKISKLWPFRHKDPSEGQ